MPRDDNANGARAKCRETAVIPITASLVRLYSEYMHTEYGDLDSDYVFVNLWSEPVGAPMRYDALRKLIARLRARTGIEFTAHMFRHTHATELQLSTVAADASFDRVNNSGSARKAALLASA